MALCLLATLAPQQASARSTLGWGPCPDGDGGLGMECAALRVPVDWSRPGGRKITLMLGRLAADRQGNGAVLVNFGAGAPGIMALRDHFSGSFTDLRHDMDIVTWDPRGYTNGLSTPLPCQIRSRPDPPLPRDQAGFDEIAARNRAVADECRDPDPALFDSIGSATHARDMEAIRKALGGSRLNFYMGSYGGAFGQAYARLFPHGIRTMVLDGTGNMTHPEREHLARARDSEQRMRRFVTWCASESSCVLRGRDIPRLWQAVVARANRTPLETSRGPLDGYTLQERLAAALLWAGPQPTPGPAGWLTDWPRIAEAIADADRGDGSGFAAVPGLAGPAPDIVACQDMPRHKNYAALAATLATLRRLVPNTGTGGTTAGRLGCLGYPTPVTFPGGPLPQDVPPLLGVGTWGDFPATNRVIEQVRGSVSIYHDGPGHELYISGNACVTRHVNTYFLSRALPESGTRC